MRSRPRSRSRGRAAPASTKRSEARSDEGVYARETGPAKRRSSAELRRREGVMPSLDIAIEQWSLKAPFRIAGYEFTQCDLVVVSLEERGVTGRGEAAGVYYHDETPDSMRGQIDNIRGEIEADIDRMALRERLPPGGARKAVDCALRGL